MRSMSYPSDLTDQQGALLEPVFNAPGKRGPKHAADLRGVVDAMLYVSHTGCQWRFLPESFGPWTRVWSQFRRWSRNGTWARALTVLHEAAREADGRDAAKVALCATTTAPLSRLSNSGPTTTKLGSFFTFKLVMPWMGSSRAAPRRETDAAANDQNEKHPTHVGDGNWACRHNLSEKRKSRTVRHRRGDHARWWAPSVRTLLHPKRQRRPTPRTNPQVSRRADELSSSSYTISRCRSRARTRAGAGASARAGSPGCACSRSRSRSGPA